MRLLLFILFFLTIASFGMIAQPNQPVIRGKVVENTGDPLPGVNVVIKRTTLGTVTDIDGNYSISADPRSVLVFSFVGYTPKEVLVGGQTTINVTLDEILSEVEEVVVTGYGDISKRLFTGASSSVSLEEVKVDGVIDVSRMLEGRIAGVNVANISGTFGAAPRITIRGASSISGDTKPLWVIDGVVQEDLVNLTFDDLTSGNSSTLIGSAVAGLNSNDIASFQILKDASATAIYGARALNGIIVITTKKGRRNIPLSFNYQAEFTNRAIPTYAQTDILNSKESLAILREMETKGLLDYTTVDQNQNSGIYGILANRIDEYNSGTGEFTIKNTPLERNRFFQQYERNNTNWFDVLFKNTITHNHTVSFSGGGKKNLFYASLGYFGDAGWTIADRVERITTNLKNTFYIGDKTSLTFNVLGSIRNQRAPGTFSSQDDVVNGEISRDFDINPYSYVLNTSRLLRPRNESGELEYYTINWAPFNILDEIPNNNINLEVQDIRFQVDFNHSFLEDKLKYAFTGSIRAVNSISEHEISENSSVAQAYRSNETTVIRDDNSFLWTDPDNPDRDPVVVLPVGGIYIKQDNTLKNIYIRNTLNFKETINLKHEMEFFLGQEIRYIDREEISFTGYGLQYTRGRVPFTDPRVIRKRIDEGVDYFGVEETKERTASFFSRATYGYNGKYFVSFTGNINASNRVGSTREGINWLPTWTISGKWNIKEENFLQNIGFLSSAQIRGSYGLTANTGNATNTLPIFRSSVTDRRLVSDREPEIFIDDLQNTDLTWEKQFETNLGVDLGFFKNRISLNLDVYERKGFDLIDFVQSSGIGGQIFKEINNADLVTRGIEFSLTTRNINTPEFKWTSTINFSHYDQEIAKVENLPGLLDAVDATGTNFVGFPRNSIFSIQFAGLERRGLPTFIDEDGRRTITGIDFRDTGIDIEPTEGKPGGLLSYLKYEGPVDANTTMSLQNTFSYKNFTLGIFISASTGNKIRLPAQYGARYADFYVFREDFKNRWILPGDEEKTNIPVIADARLLEEVDDLNRAYNLYNFSTERIADGSFVRLKTISLGYTFPKNILSKIHLKSLSSRLIVQNPLLIYSDSKLNGVDPEFFGSGGVAYPITRQYTFSFNVGF